MDSHDDRTKLHEILKDFHRFAIPAHTHNKKCKLFKCIPSSLDVVCFNGVGNEIETTD